MASSLHNLNLEEGKSDALREALACLAEASAADGGPRYTDRVIRQLARVVVCRTYARPILELSHLLVAASARDGRYEDLFWGMDRASVGAFRRAFDAVAADIGRLRLSNDAVRHSDAPDAFEVSFSRMPFLAALLEFLITTLGYDEVDDLTRPLRDGVASDGRVEETARALQRRFYAYLKDHLPPVQRQRRERHFLDYVTAGAGNRTRSDAIDDACVLGYWQAYAASDEVSARTYRGVYRSALKLIMALDAAEVRLEGAHAKSIGNDYEAGEVDPADVEAVAVALDDATGPLPDLLAASGERVKFINAREVERVVDLPLAPAAALAARRIPVSVMRDSVFGAYQTRLSAAERGDGITVDLLQGLDGPMDGSVYDACFGGFIEIAETLERASMAALSLLHGAGRIEAVEIALTLAPDLDWGALAETPHSPDDNVVPISVHSAAAQFFATKPDPHGDELPGLLAEARRALRAFNRIGFKGDVDAATLDAMAAAAPYALRLIDAIRRFVERDSRDQDWPTLAQRDLVVFMNMFKALYRADKHLETEVFDGER
tara:strand:+ start:12146 stop:13792 length:1647 start_codon:yes stop_codon:yes gene_type:complete